MLQDSNHFMILWFVSKLIRKTDATSDPGDFAAHGDGYGVRRADSRFRTPGRAAVPH
jgi:hypothetical protein